MEAVEIIFGWLVFGIVVPVLIGVAFAIASAGIGGSDFGVARAIIIFTALYCLVFFCFRVIWGGFSGLLTVGLGALTGAVIIALLMSGLLWVNSQEHTKLPRLFAGSSPDLPIPQKCNPPKGALKVFFGTNVAWGVETVIKMRGEPLLAISRSTNGSIDVGLLRLFDESGDLLVRIEDGNYQVAPGTFIGRPSKSVLIVHDKKDREVLYLSYLNRESIVVRGIFRLAGISPLVIDDSSVTVGGGQLAGNCVGNAKVAFSFN